MSIGQRLLDAVNGQSGDLEDWLETVDESEIRAAILELTNGESLRARYAARMMQSLILNPETSTDANVIRKAIGLPQDTKVYLDVHWPVYLAVRSVAYADALLAALKPRNNTTNSSDED